MATLSTALRFRSSFKGPKTSSFPILTSKPKLKFHNSNLAPTLAHNMHSFRNNNLVDSVRHISVSNAFKQNREYCSDQMNGALQFFKRWFEFIRSIFPGGSWWNFSDFERDIAGSPTAGRPITVVTALSQMWALVADDKWILYIAFGALAIAAVSEISMPGILTASVFSAQNGEMLVFYQNSKLLIFLCFTSGICSGLRSGCFAIANTILVKRLRETVYSSLLLQQQSVI